MLTEALGRLASHRGCMERSSYSRQQLTGDIALTYNLTLGRRTRKCGLLLQKSQPRFFATRTMFRLVQSGRQLSTSVPIRFKMPELQRLSSKAIEFCTCHWTSTRNNNFDSSVHRHLTWSRPCAAVATHNLSLQRIVCDFVRQVDHVYQPSA